MRKTTSTTSSSWRRFCRAEQVAIWAYCLMPNHVHLIVVPQSAESLRRAIGEAHRRYTRWINFRGKSGVLQPIMPLDLPVKVRPWELTVYPRSHIRR